MEEGHFYFIKDQYFVDFPDERLMKNKEVVAGVVHDRPSFLSFTDADTGLQWMIPISSRVSKYREIYDRKTANGKKCDTLAFGSVLGQERAFLIQNMCPITPAYMNNEYLDTGSKVPVRLSGDKEAEIIQKARRILFLVKQKNMSFLIFPDVLAIEQKLLKSE